MREVLLVHHAKRDTVDLLECVRKELRDPVGREVEHGLCMLAKILEALAQLWVCKRCRCARDKPDDVIIAETILIDFTPTQQGQQPQRHQLLHRQLLHLVLFDDLTHLRLIPGLDVEILTQQDHVRGLLQRSRLEAKAEGGGDRFHQRKELILALVVAKGAGQSLRHVCARGTFGTTRDVFGKEQRVEEHGGHLPPLPAVGEVEALLLSDGEVELGLKRMQHEIDLVHDATACTHQLEQTCPHLDREAQLGVPVSRIRRVGGDRERLDKIEM